MVAPPEDVDSMSDMGAPPSSVSSESLVLGESSDDTVRPLSKQDSGIMTSPEEHSRVLPDDQETDRVEDSDGHRLHRKEAMGPADLEHAEVQASDVLRPGSPQSVRSDDTDQLIVDYTRQLAAQSDAGSDITATATSAAELVVSDNISTAAPADADSTMTLTYSEDKAQPRVADRPDRLVPLTDSEAPASQVSPESGVSELGTPSPLKKPSDGPESGSSAQLPAEVSATPTTTQVNVVVDRWHGHARSLHSPRLPSSQHL